LGKRDLHRTNLECEPERKKTRQNLPEERRNPNQQDEPHLSQYLDSTSSLCLPLFNETTRSVSEAIKSSSVPEALSMTSEDNDDWEQESEVNWSIRYNSEVKRALDVSLVHSLQVGRFDVHCLKFSKDGKYLAMGFRRDGKTNIYDVQTGEKTWLVFHESSFLDNADQPSVQYTESH